MINRAWCTGLLLCLSSIWVSAAQLKTISVTDQPDKMSLYLTVDGKFTYKLFALINPNRIVVDLTGTTLAMSLKQPSLTNGLIRQLRTGVSDTKALRLVFDLNQNAHVKSSPWQVSGKLKGLRLDFMHNHLPLSVPKTKSNPIQAIKTRANDLSKGKAILTTALPQQTKNLKPTPAFIAHQTPISVPHSPSRSLRDVVVVLDAGHGGKDPGARGPRRSQEKDVVLAITLKLKQLIDKQKGMRAVLTRSGDYYVGLRKRLDIARKFNGDVFVSIHADAFNNPHSNGASVFALSQSGATSEAARWIAEKENYSELGGVNLGDLDDQNGVVRSVLIDLSQTATINSGLQMGGKVLSQLDRFTSLHNSKVEQARFMVLKSPDIPSILVETGFISNPQEEKNLTSSAYQTRLSQAIFQGIKGFFWESPPHGTRIEAMANDRFHIARAGETLPAIAARYHVSIIALQTLNHLPGKYMPKAGQKLLIPSTWA